MLTTFQIIILDSDSQTNSIFNTIRNNQINQKCKTINMVAEIKILLLLQHIHHLISPLDSAVSQKLVRAYRNTKNLGNLIRYTQLELTSSAKN